MRGGAKILNEAVYSLSWHIFNALFIVSTTLKKAYFKLLITAQDQLSCNCEFGPSLASFY